MVAMDMTSQVVYCGTCFDYVYDLDLERILHSEQARMDTLVARIKGKGAVCCFSRASIFECEPCGVCLMCVGAGRAECATVHVSGLGAVVGGAREDPHHEHHTEMLR